MSAKVIRCDYDKLVQLAQAFREQADCSRQMLDRLERQAAILHDGDWVGRGAQAFYQEMESAVCPSLKRLVNALEAAQRVTAQVNQVMHQAEDEAARLFRTAGSAIPAGVAAGVAAGLSGGSAGSFDAVGVGGVGSASELGPAAMRSNALGEIDPTARKPGGSGRATTVVSAAAVDRYFDSANLEYKVGQVTVTARPFFQISTGREDSDKREAMEIRRRILDDTGRTDQAFKIAVSMSACGRPSLKQLQMVTQALIDKGKLEDIRAQYPGLPLDQQIKKLQWEYGIGMDCAGYVQQAFLEAHGGERDVYGLKSLLNENVWHTIPSNKQHFQIVEQTQANPGDLLILKPPPWPDPDWRSGHSVLIRDRHVWDSAAAPHVSDPSHFVGTRDEVHIFEVDSSFGAGEDGDLHAGGVQRRQWLYNKTRDKWAEIDGGRINPSSGTGPYDHPYQGIYRPK